MNLPPCCGPPPADPAYPEGSSLVNGSLVRRAGAEFVGTYALVTAGCGAIMINAQTATLGHLGVAVTFGLVIMVMIAATGHISGAHFNPAVTVAFALTRHFPWREVPVYIGGQVLGAILAALTLKLCLGDAANLGATLPAGSVGQSRSGRCHNPPDPPDSNADSSRAGPCRPAPLLRQADCREYRRRR
ncbi:MAG: aquaporin [Anaerolineae bacterium]|nr:aquaporin [Anaerolineae bacterium]